MDYEATTQALAIAIAMNVPVVLWGMVGQGKALALDTPIFTENGWKTLDEIVVGDILFDNLGKETAVTEIYHQPPFRPCYEIDFGYEKIVADSDHVWIITFNREHYFHLTTDEIKTSIDQGETVYIKSLEVQNKTNAVGALLSEQSHDEYHIIKTVTATESVPVLCITVDSPSHTFLAGKSLIPTHNTSIMKHIAESYNMHLETVIASTREPSDFAGLPFFDNGFARLAAPMWVNNIIQQSEKNKRTSLIFYDEISTAAPATQAALLRPILENVVGEVALPKSTRTVAAANPPEIAADGWDFSAPAANRFLHLDWKLDAETVKKGFMGAWPVPEMPMYPKNLPDLIKKSMALVGYFIGANQSKLTVFPKDFSGNGTSGSEFEAASYAFPTPRSWEFAAKLYTGAEAARFSNGKGVKPGTLQLLLNGMIGKAAAKEFLAFTQALDLPNPEDLLNNPSSFKVPDRGDVLSVITDNVLRKYKTKPNSQWWIAAGDIFAKVANAGKVDIIYSVVKEWYEMRPENTVPTSEQSQALNKTFEHIKKARANG